MFESIESSKYQSGKKYSYGLHMQTGAQAIKIETVILLYHCTINV